MRNTIFNCRRNARREDVRTTVPVFAYLVLCVVILGLINMLMVDTKGRSWEDCPSMKRSELWNLFALRMDTNRDGVVEIYECAAYFEEKYDPLLRRFEGLLFTTDRTTYVLNQCKEMFEKCKFPSIDSFTEEEFNDSSENCIKTCEVGMRMKHLLDGYPKKEDDETSGENPFSVIFGLEEKSSATILEGSKRGTPLANVLFKD